MECWSQVNHELGLLHPAEPHWYLAILGVAPWAWRRGWGRALVEALGQLVAQQPAPIYLEADRPQSVGFYQGLGFENRAELDVLGVATAAVRAISTPADTKTATFDFHLACRDMNGFSLCSWVWRC